MNKKNYIFLVAMLWLVLSCNKMDETYKQFIVPDGITYVQKPAGVKSYSGYNRVKFVWLKAIDPNVVLTRIYWNNYTDSIDIPVSTDRDTVSYLLPIAEGPHTFYIRNFDAENNSSIEVEVQATSYGENKMQALFNRPISGMLLDNNVLNINWSNADLYNGAIGQELSYTDKQGETNTVFLPSSENTTKLTDYKENTPLKYRTIFVVDTTSIDSLKTDYTEWAASRIYVRLDKSKFQEMFLDNDAAPWDWPLRRIWDGQVTSPNGYCSHELLPGTPVNITFDTFVTSSLKQFRLFMRPDAAYGGGNPKKFALFGSNEPKQDGSWDVWTKLGDFTSETHNVSEGELFNMPDNLPAFRYYRMQVLSTWGGLSYTYIMEVDLYSTF